MNTPSSFRNLHLTIPVGLAVLTSSLASRAQDVLLANNSTTDNQSCSVLLNPEAINTGEPLMVPPVIPEGTVREIPKEHIVEKTENIQAEPIYTLSWLRSHLNEYETGILDRALKKGEGKAIFVCGRFQKLYCIDGENIVVRTKCSTAARGFSNIKDSKRTSHGVMHGRISMKYNPELVLDKGKKITRRKDPGVYRDRDNGGKKAYVMHGFILIGNWKRKLGIHETNRTSRLGEKASGGCIRVGDDFKKIMEWVGGELGDGISIGISKG